VGVKADSFTILKTK